ncbi:MAG TPA: amidohydrolase, partial [Flavisolibacter sp.]|nr:amidohydrolase [Flavisolibacter sp.]
MTKTFFGFAGFLSLLISETAYSQRSFIDFETYNPISTLVVPKHVVKKAKFPFIDVHNHQPGMATQNLSSLVTEMDTLNMRVMVNLTGYGGGRLKAMSDNVQKQHSKRFILFTNLDFRGYGEQDWTEKAVQRLKLDVANGAKGLKLFKEFGMFHKDNKGARIPVDDSRLDPVWAACGELKIPVLIHAAAPK